MTAEARGLGAGRGRATGRVDGCCAEARVHQQLQRDASSELAWRRCSQLPARTFAKPCHTPSNLTPLPFHCHPQ